MVTAVRRLLTAPVLAALLLAVPGMVLAVPPDGTPPGLAKNKVPKVPEVEVTLQGTVGTFTDENDRLTYTLVAGDVTYELSAGPRWYWGDNHPLAPYVGQSVTVVGMAAEGSTDVDVTRVNDTAIRAPGKPPWAGGPKRIGAAHPGWSEEKAARWGLKFGDCFPPGHCRDRNATTEEPPAG